MCDHCGLLWYEFVHFGAEICGVGVVELICDELALLLTMLTADA